MVLLTPDDEGHAVGHSSLKKRARQNVVFELGYFTGRLGRGRVCAVFKEGVEIPSDYSGVVYVPLDNTGGWKTALAHELRDAGLAIDMNKI